MDISYDVDQDVVIIRLPAEEARATAVAFEYAPWPYSDFTVAADLRSAADALDKAHGRTAQEDTR